MKFSQNKQAVDVIGIAPALWSAQRDLCPTGITPFFVMDETARTGP